MPCWTEPSDGSDLISERLGMSSTKYGPSVCCGVPLSFVDDENPGVHVLFVDALFWAADSSGGAGGGGNREVGGEEGGLGVEDDNDIVSLVPIVVVCAKESGNLIKFGYIKIKVSDSIIKIMMNIVVLSDIFSLSCINIILCCSFWLKF